jgi:hypothetical protein
MRCHIFNFAILISFQQNMGFLVAFRLNILINKLSTKFCNDFHIHIVVRIICSIKKKGNEMYFVYGFVAWYIDVQILVIWNKHESSILVNCKGMCVYDQCVNCECVHIAVQIYCYNKCGIGLPWINSHLPLSLTIGFNL